MRSSTRFVWVLLSAAATLPFLFAMDKKPSPYPPTRTDKVVDKIHGTEVADPYRWLEDGAGKEVQAWVGRQNRYTRSVLDQYKNRGAIRERLSQLLDIGTLGTPQPVRGRYFYTRREGKENQPVLYVRTGLQGKDRVLVNPNALAKDGTLALDWWYPSPDGRRLAYGLSKNGSEQSTLYVLDVATGNPLPDVIERTRAASLAWVPDGKGFYYTRYPAAGTVAKGEENYHRHVFYHALGANAAKDKEVFGKGRPAEDWPNVTLSPDGRWLVVTVEQGWAKSEVFFKDLSKPDGKFMPLVEKVNAVFDVVARNDRFYVRTNDGAPRYRLFGVDPKKPERKDWVELIREGEDVLDGFTVVLGTIAALYMHRAVSRLELVESDGRKVVVQEIKLPTLGTLAGLGAEWDGQEILYGFQSFTVPPSVYRYDFQTKKVTLWRKLEAEGIRPSEYVVEQVQYPSRDGTQVSMFLAHKKGLKRDGKNPTLLTGYGGFNISLTPLFGASRFLFLEHGGLIAIPNLRGGGEYGEEWHRAGMLDKKQNVFDDFLSAAEWLIKEKYTSPRHLAIQGGSNGGLLVGAALTQRPDLFRAVVCQVPLLDMVRYHKFLIARLWIPEYGTADRAKDFKWLYAYSPYHHVKDGTAYPAVLLEAAESDTRVDALHARKTAARLQVATSSDRPILLRLETRAGHGAGKPRTKVLDELTDSWSFIFEQLGLKV
jgi:prolyl oligopeptidase